MNVYRPPQGDYKEACNTISEAVARADLKDNTEIYLIGDFNIYLTEKSSPTAREILYVTVCMCLLPKYPFPQGIVVDGE